MQEVRVAPTADKSVVGTMNEFISLADHYRGDDDIKNLLLPALSHRLARTPCFQRGRFFGYPDQVLTDTVTAHLAAARE
jgi:hypothetical protein